MQTPSLEDANILIQKLGSDVGIHRNPRKGTLDAPEEILEGYTFGTRYMVDSVFPDEFDLEETQRRIRDNMADLRDYDKPILSIGGDHSVSYPVILSLKEKNPDMVLVWLDAHLDMKEQVDGHVSHDVVIRQLIEDGFPEDDIYLVGCSRIDVDERDFMEDREINLFEYDELVDFKQEFESVEQPVYLSVDIDVLKKELASGTGYPDGKLELEDVKGIVDAVKPENADLVEVAPSLDDGTTVESARKILKKLEKSLLK